MSVPVVAMSNDPGRRPASGGTLTRFRDSGRSRCWVLACVICVLSGCHGAPENLALVEGQVLFNGLPARAAITAQAVDGQGKPTGRPSQADTRADGTYSLIYSEDTPGAVVGPQRVTVTVYPVERAADELSFQERFKAAKVVRVTRQVIAGETNIWNFVLTY